MKMKKRTLEEIFEYEKKNRCEGGMFGMKECEESVKFHLVVLHQSLESQLKEYLKRANEDPFFNCRMVLACWEMMREEEAST